MFRALKVVVLVAALLPAAWLTYALFYSPGDLGANPAETLQLHTGIWSLRLLVLTIAITPVRRVTGWNRLVQFRRMLGLLSFFYAVLHLATYVVLDRLFDLSGIWEDVVKRPFITAGMIALLAMVPLSITSTKGWIRRLGRRWQLLHRLVYVSAIAAAIHYLWKVKVMIGPPVNYAVLVAGLLLVRVWWGWRKRVAERARMHKPAHP